MRNNGFKPFGYVCLVFVLVLAVSMSGPLFSGNTAKKQPLVHLVAPQAVTAQPGPIDVKQPDGTTLTVRIYGGDWDHYSTTTDGYTVLQDESNIYYYAQLGAGGDLEMSTVKARNPKKRTKSEEKFLKKMQKHLRYSKKQKKKSRSRLTEQEEGLAGVQFAGVSGTFPTSGNRKFLVILVNFTDKSFVKSRGSVDNIMNAGSGSFKDYYLDNSFNQLNITTTVVGPYTLSGSLSTYGANDSGGNDTNPRLMVQEAVDLANNAGLNFAQYDNDGNGNVDGVMVVHAGYGEEAGAPANTIWSHRWSLGTYARTYDGVTINDYTTVPELRSNSGSTLTGIGVICHEFGHNLGCPDTYDTDYSGSGGQAWDMKKWDVMASGSWNNGGDTPSMHNPYARWQMGWVTPTTLSSATSVTVNKVETNNVCYRINTSRSGDFFMLENRQQTGWDAYVPGHGLLIYHIDENYFTTLGSNKLNANPSHQAIDLEEADNVRSTATYSADPFPGTGSKTSFTDTTTPNSKNWSGANTGKPITNISESGGVITFDFMSGGGGATYCTSGSGDAGYEWISRFRFGGIDKSSGGATYSDFTSTSTNITRGGSVSVTLTPGFSSGSYTEYWRIWIDYNQDGDFTDSGEMIGSGSGSGSLSGTLSISSTASTGPTRLRVSMKYDGYANPCDSFSYGEVEDYTVNIQ